MNDLLRLSHCWVIWNYPHHVTLSHSCSNLLEISLRASTPCKWTLCHMKTRRAVFAYLHVSVEQLRECWQPGGVGASTGRLWLPSEPCASTCLPFGLCLPASVPQRKKKRERGRRVSPLNSDEFSPAESWEEKQKEGVWALHPEMRWLAAACSGSFVHSAVSV